MTKNKFKTKEFKIKLMIVCILLALVVLSFFFASEIERFLNIDGSYAANQVSEKEIAKGGFEVTYLDVGQGNSAFVRLPDGKTVLIDGGNTMYGDEICMFLKNKKVTAIDYMIATHADADHIGGLVKVLENFDVKNILRPFQIAGTGENFSEFVPNESEELAEIYEFLCNETNNRSKISRVTSEVYNDFIECIYDESYFENGKKIFSKVMVFYDGLKISGEHYEIEFFAPLVHEENLKIENFAENTYGYATKGYGVNESNGCSAMFLLSCFGETYFFSGDAPFSSGSKNAENIDFEETDFIKSLTALEKELLSNTSVLIVGHHGSKFSTSTKLLEILSPKFIVISVGKDNDYDHPHDELLERIAELDSLEKDYLLLTSKIGNITFSAISGETKYMLENDERDSKLTISWYELGTIIFIATGYIVVLVKPKQKRQI